MDDHATATLAIYRPDADLHSALQRLCLLAATGAATAQTDEEALQAIERIEALAGIAVQDYLRRREQQQATASNNDIPY